MPATADRLADETGDRPADRPAGPSADRAAGADQAASGETGASLVNLERLIFFSDAVVAIAITLLALGLPVPDGHTNKEVLHQFSRYREDYLAFLISFAVVGVQWFGHHRLFGYLARLGGRLPQWNMMWLLTIVLMPFAARFLTGDGAVPLRLGTYAGLQALAGLLMALMMAEMRRHHLFRPDTPEGELVAIRHRLTVVIAGFLVSIPLAFVTTSAYLSWIAVLFLAVRFAGLRSGLRNVLRGGLRDGLRSGRRGG